MAKRDVRYEFIRVIAMILVIGVHSLSLISRNTPSQVLAGHMFSTLFFLCNGLFFMLSGKFSLNARCETPAQYLLWYSKRLCTIGIPVLVFMLLRTMSNSGWWPGYLRSPELWQDYVHNILSGFQGSDYWFLYPLTGLLAAAPFLSRLVQNLSRKELLFLLGVGVCINGLNTYLPALGLPFSLAFPLGDWFVMFLLGFALERVVTTRRAENWVMLLGSACFVLTIFQLWKGFAPGVHDLAPTYVPMCAGAFLALKRLYRSGERRDRLFLAAGKHSLTVYLCHSMLLTWLDGYLPRAGFLLPLLLRILSTLLVALAAAFILDHTILAWLQLPLQKLLGRIPATRHKP